MHDIIEIICPIHGVFAQDAENHLNGQGCPYCKGRKKVTETQQKAYKKRLEKYGDIFFEKVKKLFNNEYSYEKSIYNGRNEEIIVTCQKHGDFKIKPFQHLRGHGCEECAKEKRRKKLEDFIDKANIVHNGKYKYDKVKLNTVHSNVTIMCPIHGDFEQTPSAHLNGQGCPHCNTSRLEKEIKEHLLNNNIEFEEQKRFEWLGKQSLDFYLPQYNIAIECQGRQHFKPIEIFGGLNEFVKIQTRDERKRKLCEEHGIKLLYYSNLGIKYPYTVFENKEELLKEILT